MQPTSSLTGENDPTYTTRPQENLLNVTQATVNSRLVYVNTAGTADSTAAPRDPMYQVRYDAGYFASNSSIFTNPTVRSAVASNTQVQMREQCRVRFTPLAEVQRPSTTSSGLVAYPAFNDPVSGDPVPIVNVYNSVGGLGGWPAGASFEGFLPTYNYYDCCNNPNKGETGDDGFEDLVCQPFKQARDATFEFLKRIDFIRGDRVGFVTFDRSAFLVNPYGTYRRWFWRDSAARCHAGRWSVRLSYAQRIWSAYVPNPTATNSSPAPSLTTVVDGEVVPDP